MKKVFLMCSLFCIAFAMAKTSDERIACALFEEGFNFNKELMKLHKCGYGYYDGDKTLEITYIVKEKDIDKIEAELGNRYGMGKFGGTYREALTEGVRYISDTVLITVSGAFNYQDESEDKGKYFHIFFRMFDDTNI